MLHLRKIRPERKGSIIIIIIMLFNQGNLVKKSTAPSAQSVASVNCTMNVGSLLYPELLLLLLLLLLLYRIVAFSPLKHAHTVHARAHAHSKEINSKGSCPRRTGK